MPSRNPRHLEEEVYQLTEASLRGEISSEEARQLEELLASDSAEHRQNYVKYITQTLALKVWSSAFGETLENRHLPAEPRRWPDAAAAGRASGTPADEAVWTGRSRIVALAAVAVTMTVVGLGIALLRETGQIEAFREPQPIATLTSDDEAEWSKHPWTSGASLMEGDVLELVRGRAQVSMACGAELVLKAPCSVDLSSSDAVLLRNGLLSVSMADWTSNFTIDTGSARVAYSGKRLVVNADAKRGTIEAHAIDGGLRIRTVHLREDERRGLLVSSGEGIRIHSASRELKRIKANKELFDPGFAATGPFKPLDIHNTGKGLAVGDEDPCWRIVRSSDRGLKTPRFAIVRAPVPEGYLPGVPEMSQWLSVDSPSDSCCTSNAMYTFETEFDLTGYDLSSVTLIANVLADNGVTGVRINGERVEFTPWIDHHREAVFNAYRKIEIKTGFVAGVNRIEFDVWNSIIFVDANLPNPMAFRVEWQAFGRLKSAPLNEEEVEGKFATHHQPPAPDQNPLDLSRYRQAIRPHRASAGQSDRPRVMSAPVSIANLLL